MSYQAYLDAVKAKTGKTLADFKVLAEQKGLTKHGEMVAWLKQDFKLGHGHAAAVAAALLKPDHFSTPREDRINAIFSGKKAAWLEPYRQLLKAVQEFGPDVDIAPTDTYVSFTRAGKKFGIVQPSGERLDIGLKRKGIGATERFEAAGRWNSMVTHRVRITQPDQVDSLVLDWLRQAYQDASSVRFGES